MRAVLIVLAISLLSGFPSWADESLKEGANEVGQGLKKMGQETGQAIMEGGKEIGEGLGKMGKTVGQEAKEKSLSFGEWLWDTGKKTGETFKQIGKSVRDLFKSDQEERPRGGT